MLPKLIDARCIEDATEPLLVLLGATVEPLLPSIRFEKVDPASQVSCRRFWNAQSWRKILISPV